MRSAPLLLLAVCAACATESEPPPNIVLVVMDTTRGDRLSLNGYEPPTSPELERIASEGTTFTDAWSPSPWTAPAHASLFTGLRPEHHGLLVGIRMYLVTPETLAARLAREGYRTACLTNNFVVGPEHGLSRGFVYFEMGKTIVPDTPPPAPWATDRALELARSFRAEGKPFFLFLNYMEPHLPYDPPQAQADRFLPRDIEPEQVEEARRFNATPPVMLGLGWQRFSAEKWSILSDLYDAEVGTLDLEVGRLFDGLRRAELLDDTVFVVTSDHGENIGEHDRCGHAFSVHRTLLHVPLLIRYPDRFAPGRRDSRVVRLEDIPPTLLELVGLDPPDGLDGESLLAGTEDRIARAILGGQSPTPDREREFPDFARSRLWVPLRSVYDGRHHLIRADDGQEELYDLRADPGETRNLATGESETLLKLRELLPRSPW